METHNYCRQHSWSELYQHRRAAQQRFGKTVFDLPLVKRVRDVLIELVAPGASVLEIGAGDRRMKLLLEQHGGLIDYESQDIDPRGGHEYDDLDQIRRTYDGIFALEVIEHLPLEEVLPWLTRIGELLRPGGWLLLSTPSTFYPPAYLRDVTHRTPLCYDELAGLVAAAGLEVTRVARVYHDPVHRRMLRQHLFGWLFRMIGIDFARQIVLVAKAPRQG
ncbi:MAG: methyltransferase domain-containing protein [Planctomycetes bacterium]|nr:methyltransferase domain-containing protein [Planctomycetota bacterium]